MPTRAGEMQTATAETSGRLVGGVLSGADQTALLTLLSTTNNGGFSINIDGPGRVVSGDWTAVTTMAQAASFIATQLSPAATCTWSVGTGQFTITSNSVGPASTVGFASAPPGGVNLSGATGFKLIAAQGAVSTAGTSALGPQWIPCDGRLASLRERTSPTPLPPIPGTPSTGTRMDYWLRVGRWAGGGGILPRAGLIRVPYDPSRTYFVSVADNNTETSLVNPYTVQRPPPGVR